MGWITNWRRKRQGRHRKIKEQVKITITSETFQPAPKQRICNECHRPHDELEPQQQHTPLLKKMEQLLTNGQQTPLELPEQTHGQGKAMKFRRS